MFFFDFQKKKYRQDSQNKSENSQGSSHNNLHRGVNFQIKKMPLTKR